MKKRYIVLDPYLSCSSEDPFLVGMSSMSILSTSLLCTQLRSVPTLP
nr:MAG TPA: hypothetical protein [Caudoviricetes sp.]